MAQLSVSGMTLLITGLTSGKRYAFRVYYSGPNGSGDWREPASGTELVNSTSGFEFLSVVPSSRCPQ